MPDKLKNNGGPKEQTNIKNVLGNEIENLKSCPEAILSIVIPILLLFNINAA